MDKKSLYTKIYQYYTIASRNIYINRLDSKHPNIKFFIKELLKGEATGVKAHPWRTLDQQKILIKYKPLTIIEFGGGCLPIYLVTMSKKISARQ